MASAHTLKFDGLSIRDWFVVLTRTTSSSSRNSSLSVLALCHALVLTSIVLGGVAAEAQTFTTLFSFNRSDGHAPRGNLIMDAQGNIYGTTLAGGAYGGGTVFRLDPSGNETVLHSFKVGDFHGDGINPNAGLVMDSAGNLYGTTLSGGAYGGGTVFKLDPFGKETLLYSFPVINDTGGEGPLAGLIMDAAANLYGTTRYLGAYGLGSVFKLDPSGNETDLYSFKGGSDGEDPVAPLIMDAAGNLYGTTTCCGGAYRGGTVFKVDPSGNETVIHSFQGSDGTFPVAGLLMDATGNLYGTTAQGGNPGCNGGCGTVFKLDHSGNYTVLYSFALGNGGYFSYGGLIMDAAGNLYGTTSTSDVPGSCPHPSVCGTVFKLAPSGSYTVLHSFTGRADGDWPLGTLLGDAAGNLYGTTAQGGPFCWTGGYYGCGTVFEIQNNKATNTTLSSSPNPSQVGQTVTFTATVTSSNGTLPNGETITFYNGTTVMGTAPLSAGSAALTTSALPAGIFTMKASYPGDSSFAASTSAGLRQVVNSTTKSPTSTTIGSSLNPSIYGQKVSWTATVTTSGAVPPTGTVVFQWQYFTEFFTLGSATLDSNGMATLSRSNLNADSYPLTAVYQGDANNLGSTSAALNQVVTQTTSAATITSSLNPSTQGQAVTFTAKITSPTVTPSGPVTFKAGTTVLGTAQLSGGKAVLTTSALPAGSTRVTVTYTGNSNIGKSSASVTQAVQ